MLRRTIPAQDGAVDGTAENGVLRGLDDRGEPLLDQLIARAFVDVLQDDEARAPVLEDQVVTADLDLSDFSVARKMAPSARARKSTLAWQTQKTPQAISILRNEQVNQPHGFELCLAVSGGGAHC